MSITREKIKRLEKETETLYQKTNSFIYFVCIKQADGFYIGKKKYKTLDKLKTGEGLTDESKLIIFTKGITKNIKITAPQTTEKDYLTQEQLDELLKRRANKK